MALFDGRHGVFRIGSPPTVVHCTFRHNIAGAVHWLAAAPLDRMTTFTGSGLPFASPAQAMCHTPNRGTAHLDARNECVITLHDLPNSFRTSCGSTLVPPTLFLVYHLADDDADAPRVQAVPLVPPLKYRDLVPRCPPSPSCYLERLPVRSQERILLDGAWDPEERDETFGFGLKPPM